MPSSDPHRADASWRHLGLRLAAFFLPLVLALAALEWWAAGVPNIYSVKRQRLKSLANEVDTLVLGASGAFYGIQPGLLSGSAFNLAGPQETLYEEDGVATRVLPYLPKLKRVIIQIHYATFFFRMAAAPESWRQYSYQQEWGIPPMQMKNRLDCRMWSRLALRTPRFYLNLLAGAAWQWARHGQFALDQSEMSGMDNRGWCPAVRVKPPPPDLLGLVQAKHELGIRLGMMKPEWEPDNLACLDHLLSMFRQRNIQVIFVAMPDWHTYLEVQNPECWNETERVVAQRTNNSTIYYYSFLTTPQMEPQDFYDVDHLSPRGTVRFTKLLNSTLNQGKPGSFTEGR
jgi:hypothetical protein